MGTRRFVSPTVIAAAAALFVSALITASAVPLFDPDEGYYPATAAESIDAGSGWDLHFNGAPRWDKPLLAYALIEGAFMVFGRTVAAARIPSAVEGAALVLIVGGVVALLAGQRAGGLSAAVLATTLGVEIFSRAAHPEIAVVLSIATSQLLLAVWLTAPSRRSKRRVAMLAGLAMAYGLLAKGPVSIIIPALGSLCSTPLISDVRSRWREAVADGFVAAAIAVVLAAPWYVAMSTRYGAAFVQAVWLQNVGRYTGDLVEHQAAVGSLVVPTLIALLPWTAFLPVAAWRVRRGTGDPRAALRIVMAASALVTLVFYSLSASKLASYSLALLPPLSVLIGLYLDEELAEPRHAVTTSFRMTSGTLTALALVLIIVPIFFPHAFRIRDLVGGVPGSQSTTLLVRAVAPMSMLLLVSSGLVLLLSLTQRVAALCVVGAVLPLVTLLAARPLLSDAYPWQRFGPVIASAPGPVWIHTYRAPSLTFYGKRPVQRIVGDEAVERLLDGRTAGWLVLEREWLGHAELSRRLAARHARIVDRTDRLLLVRLES